MAKTRRNNPSSNEQNHARNPSTDLHGNDTPSAVLGSSRGKPMHEAGEASRVALVTFNLGGYTKRECEDLKKRLVSELKQVTFLRTRIESINFETRSNNRTTPPIVQDAHATDPQQPDVRNRTPKGKKRGPGSKQANPFRKNPKRMATDPSAEKVVSGMMRCREILGKLMECKHAWFFNVPVDVDEWADYNEIVKTTMDLGTVKSNLDRNVYNSPVEFASDVRLTFDNALKYIPKRNHLHRPAETLLAKFEGMFDSVFRKNEENSEAKGRDVNETVIMSTEAKGREVNERVMSSEEKKTLRSSLMYLPHEKMDEFLNILKNNSICFTVDGDAIELVMESLDDHTLWELDGLVRNCDNTIDATASVAAIEKASGCSKEWSEVEEVGKEEVDITTVEATASVAAIEKASGCSTERSMVEEVGEEEEDVDITTIEATASVAANEKASGCSTEPSKEEEVGEEEEDVDITAIEATASVAAIEKASGCNTERSKAEEVGEEEEEDVDITTIEATASVAAIEKASECTESSNKGEELGEEDVDIGEEIPAENYPSVEIEKDFTATSSSGSDISSSSECTESSKKGEELGEEDVDIGEEIPAENYPSVEIEKDVTATSSSGSDTSSSSGSDSDSDSGSSSSDDNDSVQSKDTHET